jgi:hypothetical protein
MELERKPDFDMVLKRFEAWWERQIIDRPPVSIGVRPGRPIRWPQKKHRSLRERWLDVEYAVDCAEAAAADGTFLAETFPKFDPNVGPEVTATLFGCELEFTPVSSFSIPIAKSCRDILKMKPNLDTVYWNRIRAMMDLAIERGRGKWITSLTDLHTNGDLVAALRNPEDTCLDLADDLASVRAAVDHVNEFFALIYEDLWNRAKAAGLPSTSWTATLHAGTSYPVSCDFICMISPAMMAATILPAIAGECRYLERSIFHLDGPGALKHLDALLAIPELDGIQWVYGAGNEPARKWIGVYQRVQAAGKCIQINAVDIADAKAIAEHVRPEGAWFCVGGEYSREEAEEFLRWIGKWAAAKGK